MLAIIIAGAVLLDQELFRVRAVVVNGCETRPAEEVTALSAVEYGQSIFEIDLDAVRAGVERSPYYRVEDVGRVYPDRIKIVVHERRPRAVVLNLGAYLIMDEEGFILEIRPDKGYATCPMVEGLKVITYNVGQQVDSSDALQLRAMGAVLDAIEQQEVAELISTIALDNVLDIRLTTVDGYRVRIGDTGDLAQKLSWLKGTLSSLRDDGMYGGTLYLSANNASYLPANAPEQGGEGQEADGGWAFGSPETGEGGEGEGEPGEGGSPATATNAEPEEAGGEGAPGDPP